MMMVVSRDFPDKPRVTTTHVHHFSPYSNLEDCIKYYKWRSPLVGSWILLFVYCCLFLFVFTSLLSVTNNTDNKFSSQFSGNTVESQIRFISLLGPEVPKSDELIVSAFVRDFVWVLTRASCRNPLSVYIPICMIYWFKKHTINS